jgi:hypothetical protein
MKKSALLLFFIALALNVYSATIYVNVHNINGNTVSNAYVKLYDNSWNLIKTGYTNSSGMATFALLDYGTYNYEVYYTGESQEFWGSDEGFYLGNPTLTRDFTRYWPYKYSESLPGSSVIVNQQVTFSFTVKNKVSTSRSVQVELWVDRNQASQYDFHESSSFQTISSNGTKTYTFNFTPTSIGTYYWKMRVYSYLDNGSLWVTDSYNWQTAFTANYQTGDLDVYVKNVNGNYIENAFVKLYDDDWDLVETDYTNSSGKADFNDVRYGTYNYEVLYTGDTQEFWGNKENIVINSSSESSTFTRNWPFRNNYSISASNIYVGQQETINIEVKNNLSFSRNVKVELWLDRDKVSSWDYNQTSDYQTIGSGGTKTNTFNYTPSNSGTYYWKMHVLSYNDGAGGYIVTDSYSWTTAFVATQQTGDLNIYVKNVNDSYVENATVVIYNSTWETKIDSLQTDNTGKATFNDLNYGSYNYEVYYLSTFREYWGYDDFDINSSTTSITFVRDWPYIKNFSISEAGPNVGEEVDFDITIKNDLSFSRDVKVELWIDRNKEVPFDIHTISDIKTVNSILNKNFDFDVYPPAPDDYYWRAVVYSYNDGSEAFIPTDTYPWSNAFNVDGSSSPIDLKGRIAYQVYSDYLADPAPGDTIDGNIFIYDIETETLKNITYGLDVTNALNPHFNNDGSKLTFMAIPIEKAKEIEYDSDKNYWHRLWKNLDIYVLDLSSNKLIRLTDNNIADEDSKFSPDGYKIVFKRSGQIFEYNLLVSIQRTPSCHKFLGRVPFGQKGE